MARAAFEACRAAQDALIKALQDEYLAEDLTTPPSALGWSYEEIEAFFASGGTALPAHVPGAAAAVMATMAAPASGASEAEALRAELAALRAELATLRERVATSGAVPAAAPTDVTDADGTADGADDVEERAAATARYVKANLTARAKAAEWVGLRNPGSMWS